MLHTVREDAGGCARAVGVWKGEQEEQEESFVVLFNPIRHPLAAMQLVHIARGYEQDGILMADADRNAQLVPVCDPDCIGAWQAEAGVSRRTVAGWLPS